METKNLNTLAVAKAVKEAAMKDARAHLTVGTHNVDTVVRIKGTVTVGKDYTQRIVEKAEPWKLLAVALSKLNGVTVEALIRESLSATIDEEVVKDGAEKAMEIVKGTTSTECKGKVTTELTVEFFNTAAAKKVAAAA